MTTLEIVVESTEIEYHRASDNQTHKRSAHVGVCPNSTCDYRTFPHLSAAGARNTVHEHLKLVH